MTRAISAVSLALALAVTFASAEERKATLTTADSFELPLSTRVTPVAITSPLDADGNLRVVEQSAQPKQVEVVNFPAAAPCGISNSVLDLLDTDVAFPYYTYTYWYSSVFDTSQFNRIYLYVGVSAGETPGFWCSPSWRITENDAWIDGDPSASGGTGPNLTFAAVRGLQARIKCQGYGTVGDTIVSDVKVLLRRE